MSPRNSDAKPVPDVWVALLFISTGALIAGITLLYFELDKYGWLVAK